MRKCRYEVNRTKVGLFVTPHELGSKNRIYLKVQVPKDDTTNITLRNLSSNQYVERNHAPHRAFTDTFVYSLLPGKYVLWVQNDTIREYTRYIYIKPYKVHVPFKFIHKGHCRHYNAQVSINNDAKYLYLTTEETNNLNMVPVVMSPQPTETGKPIVISDTVRPIVISDTVRPIVIIDTVRPDLQDAPLKETLLNELTTKLAVPVIQRKALTIGNRLPQYKGEVDLDAVAWLVRKGKDDTTPTQVLDDEIFG